MNLLRSIGLFLLTAMLVSCATRYADSEGKNDPDAPKTPTLSVLTSDSDGVWVLSDGKVLTTIVTNCKDVRFNDTTGVLLLGYPAATYAYSERTTAKTSSLTTAQIRTREHAVFSTLHFVFDDTTKIRPDAAFLSFRLQTYRGLQIPTSKDTAALPASTAVDAYSGYFGLSLSRKTNLFTKLLATQPYATDIICYLVAANAKTGLATCTIPGVRISPADTVRINISDLTKSSAQITIDTTYVDTIYYQSVL